MLMPLIGGIGIQFIISDLLNNLLANNTKSLRTVFINEDNGK